MTYDVQYTKAFNKSLRKMPKVSQEKAKALIKQLANGETLDIKHKDHALNGELKAYRECHIKPDLLKTRKYFAPYCIDIGSHNELFK